MNAVRIRPKDELGRIAEPDDLHINRGIRRAHTPPQCGSSR